MGGHAFKIKTNAHGVSIYELEVSIKPQKYRMQKTLMVRINEGRSSVDAMSTASKRSCMLPKVSEPSEF